MHDSRNRLTAYSGNTYNASTGLPTGSSQTSVMRYDADGRRVSMTDSNGTDLGFIHAGDMEIADLDMEGGTYNGVLRRYIPGAATDERVALITVNPATGATLAREYYHANRLGSVIAMADETGAITAQYVYTPYGVESPYNASGNPFRYTGRRLDAQWGVYYYRARYYDPQLGRFLETDPAGYVDSMNLYAYVGHDPLNLTDPTGECPMCIGAIIGGLVSGAIQTAAVMADPSVDVWSAEGAAQIGLATAAGAAAGATGVGVASKVGGLLARSSLGRAAMGTARTQGQRLLARAGVRSAQGAAGGGSAGFTGANVIEGGQALTGIGDGEYDPEVVALSTIAGGVTGGLLGPVAPVAAQHARSVGHPAEAQLLARQASLVAESVAATSEATTISVIDNNHER